MTEREALATCIKFVDFGIDEVEDVVINALKKQIEKKPVGLYKNICPSCSWHIVGSNQKYCSDCGQKLDWSEV